MALLTQTLRQRFLPRWQLCVRAAPHTAADWPEPIPRPSTPSAVSDRTRPAVPWQQRAADTISALLSPPVMGVAMVVIAATAAREAAAWAWAGPALALNVLAPIGYLAMADQTRPGV